MVIRYRKLEERRNLLLAKAGYTNLDIVYTISLDYICEAFLIFLKIKILFSLLCGSLKINRI